MRIFTGRTGWLLRGGYQGAVLYFYDFETGDVYQPFEKKRNVVYSRPEFADGYYYFLQGDYDAKTVVLYRYFPDDLLAPVVTMPLDDVDLYNLRIVGNPVHIISQNEALRCYYPEAFSFPLEPNETVCFIEDGRVYIEALRPGSRKAGMMKMTGPRMSMIIITRL